MYQHAQNLNSTQNAMQQNSFCSAGNQMQWNQQQHQQQQYPAQIQSFNSPNSMMHTQQQMQYQQQLQVSG